MHGDRMWSWRWVKRAIDEGAAHGLNALVLHKNDLLDMLAFPARYFDVEQIWARWPVRYHNIDNNRQYLRAVLRHAGDSGMRVFLQVKEVSFHDFAAPGAARAVEGDRDLRLRPVLVGIP